MISGVNNISWIDQNIELVPNSTPPPPSPWPNINTNTNTNTIIIDTHQNQSQNQSLHNNKDNEIDSLCSFKPILDIDDQDWYMSNNENNNIIIQSHHDIITDFIDQDNALLLNQVDLDLDYSSTSCSPTDVVFNTLHTSQIPYFPPLLNDIHNNAFTFLEAQASSEALLGGFNDFTSNNNDQITLPSLCPDPKIQTLGIPHVSEAVFGGFEEGLGKPMFVNRPKMLRPLESLPPSGAQPTLFQKRVALRKKLEENDKKKDCENMRLEEKEKKRRMSGVGWEEIVEDVSVDGCALNYDSDEMTENKSGVNGGGGDGGDRKGKKKGMPAKNLMAERRRRKKLNDRLYMLRSVVPKISKMDRASILGDAIEYLKELLQKINDINTELESTPPGSALSATAPSFHPLTPTPPALPARIKDELCPSSLPSPNCQPARIEVRMREGKAVNIHMFCARKPGILLSTMKALDNLGLDIHQAVISCFNGFAMDVFRAEQWNEVQEVPPEQIKAVLLESAGYHGTK